MTLDEIKSLIDFIRDRQLNEFELEQDGVKIRVKSGVTPHVVAPVMVAPAALASTVVAAAAPAAPAIAAPAAADSEPAAGDELAIVKSPIVGTFYRAAEPDAKPFVEVGDTVKKDQVLCIIEAMKLMNEIGSEVDGTIASIYVENGQPVQYGERMFAIRLK
jgi:acetyl-CoA carboxylase biotin carboxyl carrier protein